MQISSVFLLFSLYFVQAAALAQSISVSPQQNLQQVLLQAKDGDEIRLDSGLYSGNFELNHSLTLSCQQGAEINGGHTKDTLRVKASHVTIQGCYVTNWGDNLTDMNAGIYVEQKATGVVVRNNHLHGDAFGILLDGSANGTVSHNSVEGDRNIRSQDRGNGIHLFNVTQALVSDNEVWNTRDGIYIDTSNGNQLLGNYLHDLRFGIHYMYSYNNHIEHNHTQRTRTGYALMQSKYLTVLNNRSENDSNYGILMNFIEHSTITHNEISNTHQLVGPGGTMEVKGGEGKSLFIYNSPFNQIDHNRLSESNIGIHLTAGSEDNKIFANEFIRNQIQVKYAANKQVEWSYQKVGNFWSDYQGWDQNMDGIGDEPFEPNDGIDKLLWKYPSAQILMSSPAIQTLRWVQKEFPVLKSPGIKDSYPLMTTRAHQLSLHQEKP